MGGSSVQKRDLFREANNYLGANLCTKIELARVKILPRFCMSLQNACLCLLPSSIFSMGNTYRTRKLFL